MKEKQLQWHECWDCENYDQLEKRCDKLNIQKARDSFSTCCLFHPRDLEECQTCFWYNKDLYKCAFSTLLFSTLFIDPEHSCSNYEYKYKENK